MAALINALDNFSNMSIGENGHQQYSWSTNIEERIVQLNFQLVRDANLKSIESKLRGLLTDIFSCNDVSERAKYITIICKLIAHTRDIIAGKGECKLTYMMIDCLYDFDQFLACSIISLILNNDENNSSNIIQYGSWKDLKGLCAYIKERNSQADEKHKIIDYCVSYANHCLKKDVNSKNPSLLAKWLPREGSKYTWLFNILACDYFSEYLESAKIKNDNAVKERAIKKAKMDYRKICSQINKTLDTTQVKQCGKQWSQIDPNKVTSITMNKHKKAFLNIKKDGSQRSELEDRIKCAENFNEYIKKIVKGEVEAKGARIGIVDFVKSAYRLQPSCSAQLNEIQLLNAQWENNSKQTGALGKFIAMVDVSGSMNGNPMDAAIGLGIRVAEKSSLGNRVMTFSENPTWVNLDPELGFVAKVHKVKQAEWNMNTNFYAALQLILKAIKTAKMPAEDVENMVLAVFSDMQIDQADSKYGSMYSNIEKLYAETGIAICGKPYKPPHILFWNLRHTGGFPNLTTQANTSMLSGFSPAMLNIFCELGLEGLQQFTPWTTLMTCLANERYNQIDKLVAINY